MSVFNGLSQILLDTIDNMTNTFQDSLTSLNSLQQRIETVEQRLSDFNCSRQRFFESKTLKLSLSYQNNEWSNQDQLLLYFFSPETRPLEVQKAYSECRPIPELDQLNKFRRDGLSSLKLFSDPEAYYKEDSTLHESITHLSSIRQTITKKPSDYNDLSTSSQTLGPATDSITQIPQDSSIIEIIPLKEDPIPLESNDPVPETKVVTESVSLPKHERSFLHDIRNLQFNLKKVGAPKRSKTVHKNSDIAAILMRRVALEQSDSEKHDSSDESEDSWK